MNIHMERKKMKNSKGFTLIEVLIVIAIIGVLSAIAIPSISSWLPNYRLKSAARDLYGAAMKAKGEAVKRNVNCAITFNQQIGGISQAYIVYVDADTDCEFDAGETIVSQLTNWPKQVMLDTTEGGGDGLTFTDNDHNNPTISFRPNAVPTGNGGGFANGGAYLINSNGHTRGVIINVAGNIRIE